MYSMAIGAGIGYLAGNPQARRKTAEIFRQLKESPQAKAVEDTLGEKVNTLTAKATGRREIDITDPAYGGGGADAVDPGVFTPTGLAPERPSMVPH